MRKLKPVTPGELLREEFLVPMGISQYRVAKEIGVPAQRIGEIVAGKRAITADTDLRLCRFFGLSNGYWLRAQAAYDTEIAELALGKTLAKIKPWAGTAAWDIDLYDSGKRHVRAKNRRCAKILRPCGPGICSPHL
jgi:addiction module HigA family antidote